MRPILFEVGGVPIVAYALMLALAFAAGFLIRRSEVRRLGYASDPAHRWIAVGALLGAVIGAKLGMLLFEPVEQFARTLDDMVSLDLTGKTVIGGLAGGFLGVEVTKKIVGIRESTGDAFALAIPVAQSIGRLGCFLNGCCYGTEWGGPWAIPIAGAPRHPTQLYEAALDLGLAAYMLAIRRRPLPRGHLFRRYIVGYAAIRFALEPLRGDPSVVIGPLTAVQWVSLAAGAGFAALLYVRERRVAERPST